MKKKMVSAEKMQKYRYDFNAGRTVKHRRQCFGNITTTTKA